MKKIRKLLAGFMMLAMVVTMLPMLAPITVNADTTDPTIDKTQKGSLTLYKYESSTTYTTTDDNKGSGESGQIPSGDNKAISNVGFKLYKITDINSSDFKYYTESGEVLPQAAPSNLGSLTPVEVNGEKELFTDANGKVKWSNLDLGIYYVVESTPPVSATSAPVNFYVSIPMTKVDGTGWLYNVTVYPKNTTSYAGVKLLKYANGDKSNKIQGAKFVLQKKDTSSNWKYVINTGTEDDPVWEYSCTDKSEAYVFTTNTNGYIEIEDLSHGEYQFIETEAPNGYIMDGTKKYPFKIKSEDQKVYENGIDYAGDSSTNDEITDSTIPVNNEKPDVDKQIKRADGTWGETSGATTTYYDDADYSIGDRIPYRIKVDVPSNITQLQKFTVSDTMTNQTLVDEGNFKIYANEALTSEILSNSYTVTKSAGGWSISFNKVSGETITSSLENYADQSIYIYFEAELTADATIAGNGNPNDITLTYSNQILEDTSTGDNTLPTVGESVLTDRVVVYTFKIDLTKTFTGATVDSATLNAKFQLYRKTITGESATTTLTVGTKTVNVVAVGSEITTNWNVADLKGIYTFKGLENGEYYLVETATASGYNLLKEPVKIDVNLFYKTTISTASATGTNGSITETTSSATNYYESADENAGEATSTDVTATIQNSKGFQLPTTGGVGTYIFIFVGVSMMAAAVILFFATKKKGANKSA